jgi:hypothetical protein
MNQGSVVETGNHETLMNMFHAMKLFLPGWILGRLESTLGAMPVVVVNRCASGWQINSGAAH